MLNHPHRHLRVAKDFTVLKNFPGVLPVLVALELPLPIISFPSSLFSLPCTSPFPLSAPDPLVSFFPLPGLFFPSSRILSSSFLLPASYPLLSSYTSPVLSSPVLLFPLPSPLFPASCLLPSPFLLATRFLSWGRSRIP